MKHIFSLTAFVWCLFFFLPVSAAKLGNLKVEYAETPLGIDEAYPRFSWQMLASGGERGLVQKAYRLRVYAPGNLCVWDSGKVLDGNSLNIRYAGEALRPETRYDWKLDVWEQQGGEPLLAASWFETGLMERNDSGEGWSGAQWIGGGDDDLVLYSHYLPVFGLDYIFRFPKDVAVCRAAFVYGANDERLSDPNKNLFALSARRNESYFKVELDVSPLAAGKEAMVRVYRQGYHPTDQAGVPLHTFSLPKTLLHAGNLAEEHTLSLTSELGYTRFSFDGTEVKSASVNLNPLGQGGDFIAFPVVGDVGFYVPQGQEGVSSRLEIRNFRSPANRLAVISAPLPLAEQDAKGTLYLTNPTRNASPMLRTVFKTAAQKIVRARLYATARGIYDVYLNGERVGADYFNPGITQYNKTHLYQSFDVTSLVREGNNALGAVLAEGWWSGGCTFSGNNWNYFGDRQSFLAKLVLMYADGTTTTIVTDPETWKFFGQGPVCYGSFFQGEVYDATREQLTAGWSSPAYDDASWEQAQVVPLEGTVSEEGGGNSPWVNDYSDYHLYAQYGQTVHAVRELTAQSVEEVRPGVFVYDMGQNMVGVPHISLSGIKPGTKIVLRYAEVKYPDMPRYAGHENMIMLENIRAAMAQDIYIAKGGEEVIAPRFTYHGYRFIEITGISQALPVEAVRGTVLSSIGDLASAYETSNTKVNRLWENIMWSTYANFLSIPTDCPQRNERMGWAGDISVFSRTATYLANVPQFLRRYLQAMRDVQRTDGRFPDIAPLGGGFGGLLWGSAGITVPWECYQQYGDKTLLAEHYDAMKRYVGYVQQKCINPENEVLEQEKVWGNLGDWLGPENGRNDATLLWEAYFIYDLDILSQMASVLGHEADEAYFRELKQKRIEFFNRTYIHPQTGKTRCWDGTKEVDTQTSYVLPLAFGILPEEVRRTCTDNLVETILQPHPADDGKQYGPYSLMTGFIGTAWICPALSEGGRSDVAYRLLQQTSFPSWLYSVEQGATTIWERLNSYTHVDGFGENNRMNSFNHYSFGAVGAWMYSYSLGIRCDRQCPGFRHFILAPEPDPTGQMTFARGYYDSMYGRIASSWQIAPKEVIYEFTVPANTTASLYLPATSLASVTEGGKPIGPDSEGIVYRGSKDGKVELQLASGNYVFRVMRQDME